MKCIIYIILLLADRDAVLGSEQRHPSDVFLRDVSGDDQDGGVCVTQLVGAVHLTDGPALVGEALRTHTHTHTHTHL